MIFYLIIILLYVLIGVGAIVSLTENQINQLGSIGLVLLVLLWPLFLVVVISAAFFKYLTNELL